MKKEMEEENMNIYIKCMIIKYLCYMNLSKIIGC